MSDWQAGDLALRVRGPNGCDCGCGEADVTRIGCVYEVIDVDFFPGWGPHTASVVLFFKGVPSETENHRGHRAGNYQKVTPLADDEFDRETIALMNGVKESVA